jgi:Tfp pilus assembly major pilin PilA
MKKYICLLALAALMPACEKKETTVTNPPAESKTENNTTVVKEPGAATKTETNVNTSSSPGTSTTTTTSSPNP